MGASTSRETFARAVASAMVAGFVAPRFRRRRRAALALQRLARAALARRALRAAAVERACLTHFVDAAGYLETLRVGAGDDDGAARPNGDGGPRWRWRWCETLGASLFVAGAGLNVPIVFAPLRHRPYPLRISLPMPPMTPVPDRRYFCF